MISKLHKQLIIISYVATIVFTVASLSMFFIEEPYKGNQKCSISNPKVVVHNLSELSNCVITKGKEPSDLINGLINADLISGASMIVLSIFAFNDRRKHPEDYSIDNENEDNGEEVTEGRDDKNT